MNSIDIGRINHFVLRKQHLTDASRSDGVLQAVQDIGGLHATGSMIPYLSLFARVRGFRKEALDEELYVRKNLAKIRCMRKTVHVLTKEMMPVAYRATTATVEKASRGYCEFRGVTAAEYDRLSARILDLLTGREMSASEIKSVLSTELDVSAVLYLMCDQALLVRGRPQKGWKDRTQLYARFDEYFPTVDPRALSETEATTLLVEQYLSSFGPVTENDIAWWTGLGKTKVRRALKALRGRIVEVQVTGVEGTLMVLRDDEKELKDAAAPKERTVNLLPLLDPYLMGYKERQRYLNPEHREYVFDSGGNATSTILLNGRVVGVWECEEHPEPGVKIFMLHEVDADTVEDIRLEARKMGKFISGAEPRVRECESMTPLTARRLGSFMSPLKGC